MKNLFDLTEKTAVVTGGAGLLGKVIAKSLAAYGATVYVADLNLKSAKVVCSQSSNQLIPIVLDITKTTSIQSSIQKILRQRKRIDIWINCAYPKTKDWGAIFEKVKASSWKKNIDAHLNGYCFCCQAVAEIMKKQKSGSIINMASIYGVQGPDFSIYENTNMTMPAAYSVIKGGIVNFTRYLACYYGKYNVRINTVSPGGVLNGQPKTFIEKYSRKTPLKRMATPEDIVGAVLFLAASASSYVTGHNLVIDGGLTVS